MCDIALRPKIHCMTSVHSIWGTCRFLGTTMLIFRKFIKIATFFVYKSSSYDAQIKRYLTLKFSLRPQKCTIFTYWGLPKPTVRLFGTHCKYILYKNYVAELFQSFLETLWYLESLTRPISRTSKFCESNIHNEK